MASTSAVEGVKGGVAGSGNATPGLWLLRVMIVVWVGSMIVSVVPWMMTSGQAGVPSRQWARPARPADHHVPTPKTMATRMAEDFLDS